MPEKAVLEKAVLLAEALIFSNAEPVKPALLAQLWQEQGLDVMVEQTEHILAILAQRYDGHAIELYAVAGGWQFRTRPDMAQALTRLVERPRRLGRSAMESLAIIAYHQPCTKTEIEAIRGVGLGQGVFDSLLEEGLVAPKGRKEVPGRPILWGTTPAFLQLFGLNRLADLPDREELVQEDNRADPPTPFSRNPVRETDAIGDIAGDAVSDGEEGERADV